MSEVNYINIPSYGSGVHIALMGYNYDWLTNVFLSSNKITFPSLTAIDRFTEPKEYLRYVLLFLDMKSKLLLL